MSYMQRNAIDLQPGDRVVGPKHAEAGVVDSLIMREDGRVRINWNDGTYTVRNADYSLMIEVTP